MATRREGSKEYVLGEPVSIYGSFQTNAAGAPTIFRDGHCFAIKSVTRVSAGLYEVTFDDGFPIPELPVVARAGCNAIAVPVICADAFVIDSTWSQPNRKFRITTLSNGSVGGAAAAPTIADPDTGSRVWFEIKGSVNSAGTDVA